MHQPALEGDPGGTQARPKVEIGWLFEGDLSRKQRDTAKEAADTMRASLAKCMPQFEWVTETMERPAETAHGMIEPVRLLDSAEIDREARGWDFAFVVTSRHLQGRQRSRVLGMTSGLFATALLSTAFLTAESSKGHPAVERIHALAMHLFGRLNGLGLGPPTTWMGPVDTPSDLTGRHGFDQRAAADLSAQMEDVADLRVEEMLAPRKGRIGFYARSLWQNRAALPRAILRMHPWSFPLRLRRLTTAAGSALAVLMMTAESWEVAANLSGMPIVCLSLVAILATSAYLVSVQRLIAARSGPLRELRVVRNAGTVVAVGAGMTTTYAGVFAVAWLLAIGLFGDSLIEAWTGTASGTAGSVRLRVVGLAAALSVVIGALGASFEPYGYFRHVTQIDDEI